MKNTKEKKLTNKMREAFKESAYKTLSEIPNKESWLRVRAQFMNDKTFPAEFYDVTMDVLNQIAKERGYDIEIALDNALDIIMMRK